MNFKSLLGMAAAMLTLAAAPAIAEGIDISQPYAITSGGPTGAAFMMITNSSDTADRLIDVRSDLAAKTELHTHIDKGDGVMQMVHVTEGFELPAGATLMLERGGKHVMFMGLNEPLAQGQEITITLVFEHAGEITLTFAVNNEFTPMGGEMGGMNHDHMNGMGTMEGMEGMDGMGEGAMGSTDDNG